jgi:hypothetical protein
MSIVALVVILLKYYSIGEVAKAIEKKPGE